MFYSNTSNRDIIHSKFHLFSLNTLDFIKMRMLSEHYTILFFSPKVTSYTY